MGQAVAQLAREQGWPVVVTIDADRNVRGSALTRANLDGANVVVEFTTPDAAPDNIRAAVNAGLPVVVGTTGWYDQLDAVSKSVERAQGAMLWAPNFSIGVNIFWEVAARAAELASRIPSISAHIVETHHAAKKDAPSGTAQQLQRRIAANFNVPPPITSVRVGHVPGTHELILDAPFEQLRVTHSARDRRVFAEGAVLAATWILGRHGVFTIQDLLAAGEVKA